MLLKIPRECEARSPTFKGTNSTRKAERISLKFQTLHIVEKVQSLLPSPASSKCHNCWTWDHSAGNKLKHCQMPPGSGTTNTGQFMTNFVAICWGVGVAYCKRTFLRFIVHLSPSKHGISQAHGSSDAYGLSLQHKSHGHSVCQIIWLVALTILKNISQWKGLSYILWKIIQSCSKPPTSYVFPGMFIQCSHSRGRR